MLCHGTLRPQIFIVIGPGFNGIIFDARPGDFDADSSNCHNDKLQFCTAQMQECLDTGMIVIGKAR